MIFKCVKNCCMLSMFLWCRLSHLVTLMACRDNRWYRSYMHAVHSHGSALMWQTTVHIPLLTFQTLMSHWVVRTKVHDQHVFSQIYLSLRSPGALHCLTEQEDYFWGGGSKGEQYGNSWLTQRKVREKWQSTSVATRAWPSQSLTGPEISTRNETFCHFKDCLSVLISFTLWMWREHTHKHTHARRHTIKTRTQRRKSCLEMKTQLCSLGKTDVQRYCW